MKLNMKLQKILEPWIKTSVPDLEIKGLHNDSRKLKPGFLFLAYPGHFSDGRLYIERAMQAGAVAMVYEPENVPNDWNIPEKLIAFPMSGLAQKMASLAAQFYEYPGKKIPITGITGTNGKTTIAFQLAQAHELLSTPASYIGTLGEGKPFDLNALSNTTPDGLCLQGLLHRYKNEGTKQVCMEVSSHALVEHRVDCVDFTQAIFTNLTHEHMDFHHTMEAYARAKAMLFQYPSLQYAIINQDDTYANFISKHVRCESITYGVKNNAQIKALNWNISLKGTEIELDSPWGRQTLKIQALGFFNIYNALAVYTSLMLHGYSVQDVLEIMYKIKPAPGRMEVVYQNPYVLVDYAHTPDALENVLNTLTEIKTQKIITVFGCGGGRDTSKRPMMGKIAEKYSDIAIMTSDNPRQEDPLQILTDIEKGMIDKSKMLKISDRKEAIAKALSIASPEDIIVIAGKGHESYQQIGEVKYPFSDQKVVLELVNSRTSF
jgi:UDP-N-acetylmuramoyl-L-alanyl-D-glutamate--2,6-diaminopimelate ligase